MASRRGAFGLAGARPGWDTAGAASCTGATVWVDTLLTSEGTRGAVDVGADTLGTADCTGVRGAETDADGAGELITGA